MMGGPVLGGARVVLYMAVSEISVLKQPLYDDCAIMKQFGQRRCLCMDIY